MVTLSKPSRKVGEREQTKRDRQHLLSAIHAVRTKVAFKNVPDSFRSAVQILGLLDPEFHGTHVFADLGHRTTITHACLNVADALDSWLSKDVRAQRCATRFKHPLEHVFSLLNFSCVCVIREHSLT